MTLIELLFAVCVVALIVLQCVTIRLLRDTLHTLLAKGSARRQWPKVDRKG